MLARVQEDVRNSVANLARRAEHVQVIAIRENRSAATEYAVHGTSEARSECLHAAAERIFIVCFYDQVRMIALNRVVAQPEVIPLEAGGEAALELAHQS